MIALLSIISVASGMVVAYLADRTPALRARAELCGGGLLVLGLAMIGSGLPIFR